jgi:hypothetical protein
VLPTLYSSQRLLTEDAGARVANPAKRMNRINLKDAPSKNPGIAKKNIVFTICPKKKIHFPPRRTYPTELKKRYLSAPLLILDP